MKTHISLKSAVMSTALLMALAGVVPGATRARDVACIDACISSYAECINQGGACSFALDRCLEGCLNE